jgi:DNA invertase Pin-like site-specific DNA recombinase
MQEHSNKLAGAGASPRIRCAVYTRYSSDLQSSTSSEDQLRNCRALATVNGWDVLDKYIRSDEELTGRTLVGREGIADLLRLAEQRPKPFDCILIDDTSRLGRDLPDVLKACDMFIHNGVFIYFVSDRLDSRDESFRIVHLVKGYGDERYSKDLGKKIHRGQEGKIRNGYTSGASCYGYTNAYIRDASQKGIHGEDKVVAVKQQIVSEQAEIIVRIMEMRASGLSFARIAKILKAEGVPAPQRKYKGKILNYWLPSTIKQMTYNELYRGVRHWNRTQRVVNPANGKKNKRVKQQSEWIQVGVPDLRIVTDELWERVQQVNRKMKDKLYGTRVGGLHANHGHTIVNIAVAGSTLNDEAYGPVPRELFGLPAGLPQSDDPSRIAELVLRIREDKPQALLISAGGNDVAGEEFFPFINNALSGLPPVNEAVLQGVVATTFKEAYRFMINNALAAAGENGPRKMPILIHGYDYPWPDGRGVIAFLGWRVGPWFDPTFNCKNFPNQNAADMEKRRQIVATFVDALNSMQRALAEEYSGKVFHVDLTNTLKSQDEWANELHPRNEGFAALAAKIDASLQQNMP